MTDSPTTTTRREVGRLIAQRRAAIDDEHVTGHDKVNDDGQKIRELTERGPGGTSQTIEVNWSKLFTSGPSTTSNLDILYAEAEIAADAESSDELGDNPHIPATDDILEALRDRLENDDLQPAWEVVGE